MSPQVYAIQHLKVNLVIMQVVWDKNRICRGRRPLAFLQQKLLLCSSALALLIFRTFEQQIDLLLEANIRHNTCKADKQEQLRTIHQA
jgi:hypothetical protein